jgi:hypothetical protein
VPVRLSPSLVGRQAATSEVLRNSAPDAPLKSSVSRVELNTLAKVSEALGLIEE